MSDSEEQTSVATTQVEQENSSPAATLEQEPAANAGFNDFGFGADLLQGISEAGFTEPTLIQQKAIPVLLTGRDLIGQALTGSGKTAAFGLPAMELIRGKEGLQFLVLVPTRELAAQVSSELFKLGHHAGVKTAAFTGGQAYSRQEKLLRQGINILVATPGRLIDLMNSGHFDQINPAIIVVDEADEMLDMGFLDDVKTIFEKFPGPRQTMLFSATLPKPVVALAQKILQDPVDITTAISEATNNDIEQEYFVIEEYERVNAVVRLIDSDNVSKAIIFCRTKEETDALNILLGGRGYNVNCLHGDMEQAQRSRVMAAFRKSEIDILVATDVAARGLDVEDVSHVFNFHLPFDSRGYVHRIGRTGRAGKSGKAITLVTPRELRQLEAIRRSVGANLHLGTIPTRQEVHTQRLQKLFAELFASQLDPALYNQVLDISKDLDNDPQVLFTKLLTRFLNNSSDQGPEKIGLSGDRLQRVVDQQGRPRRDGDSRSRERRGGSRWSRPRRDSRSRDFSRDDNRERSSGDFSRDSNRERAPRDFSRDGNRERSTPAWESSERRSSERPARESRSGKPRNIAGFERASRIAENIDRQRQANPFERESYRGSAAKTNKSYATKRQDRNERPNRFATSEKTPSTVRPERFPKSGKAKRKDR